MLQRFNCISFLFKPPWFKQASSFICWRISTKKISTGSFKILAGFSPFLVAVWPFRIKT